jgi:tryptophan-rich sensory protein
LYGKIVAVSVAVAFAGLIFGGLAVRERNEARGSLMIGVGVLPGTLLVTLFWFPPVAAVGVLSIFVAWIAFADAARQRRSMQPIDVPD